MLTGMVLSLFDELRSAPRWRFYYWMALVNDVDAEDVVSDALPTDITEQEMSTTISFIFYFSSVTSLLHSLLYEDILLQLCEWTSGDICNVFKIAVRTWYCSTFSIYSLLTMTLISFSVPWRYFALLPHVHGQLRSSPMPLTLHISKFHPI